MYYFLTYRPLISNIESYYPTQDFHLDGIINEYSIATQQAIAKTSGFKDLAVYVNYAHGDEGPEAWYGKRKLPKLRKLKAKWDPEGLFSWFNPVN